MKYTLIFSLFFLSAFAAAAQTKTVTNADLEKYRQARVAAEKEYRENYARLGLPSPEELERRAAEQARERTELSARLRAERLENENAEALRRQTELLQRQYFYNAAPNANQNYYQPNYLYGYPAYGFYYNNYPNRFRRPNNNQYDTRTRLWSFTDMPERRPRGYQPPQIIRPPRR